MLTRVVAKQAKPTKVKNKFVSGKKKFKRKLSCLFGGRGKVQFRRKKLGNKVQAKSSNLPRRFCSNSVGIPLEFTAFHSGLDAKYSRASAFWFFSVHNHGFYGVPSTYCQEKHQHFHADRQLVTKKEISIKINLKMTIFAHGLVDYYPASDANIPGSVFSLVFRVTGKSVFWTGKAALLKIFFYPGVELSS